MGGVGGVGSDRVGWGGGLVWAGLGWAGLW